MEKLLTIAGSDSSGGAGIQADLKTFMSHGSYGMSVITALTAQNTTGVTGVLNISGEFVSEQIDRVFEDIRPDAVKIGMVSDKEIVLSIKKGLEKYKANNIVLDPVMVATSGSNLMQDETVTTLIEELLPIADIITPNMSEAGVLAGMKVENKEDMLSAAKAIRGLLDGAILIKGGHLESEASDLLMIKDKIIWLDGEKIDNPNTHGTGCTLSSSIAANLAKGYDIETSVRKSKQYISDAIKDGLDLGKGRGPLNHAHNLRFR